MSEMSRILCIYPNDYSTSFLNRIQTYLKRELGASFHCFKIRPNRASHDLCLKRLAENKSEEFIIFFGHGGSDYLFGATNQDISLSESVGLYGESNPYNEERFINRENIGAFSGKKVFCFSCASAPVLARLAVQNGAKVFLGFGAIPTENEEFKKNSREFPVEIIKARFKAEIVWIIKYSLIISLKRNYSFIGLANTIKLLTHTRINQLIMVHKNLRERRVISDYLFNFADQIMVIGNKNEKLCDFKQ